ncbi:hypothetical protein [Bradyrhizobium sp. USDA 4502]
MMQQSPVHLAAGFFETIAADPQRIARKTEARGIPGMPDAVQLIASTCMFQNTRSAIGLEFVRTQWR